MSALTGLLLLICIAMPNFSTTTTNSIPITHIDNFSNTYSFYIPRGYMPAVAVEESLVVQYSSIDDVDTWPFWIRNNMRSEGEHATEKYVPPKFKITNKLSEPIYFNRAEYYNVTNVTIDHIVITRNPNIVKLIFTFTYSLPISIPQAILAYASLPFLAFCIKSPLLIPLVLLYFASFSSFTTNQSALFYRLYSAYLIFITFRHTSKHSTIANALCDVLRPAGICICALYSIVSILKLGFQCPFAISTSPVDILCGLSIVQIIGLVAANQSNLPIFLDFIGAISTMIPYVLQLLLPVYISGIRACAASYLSASILSLNGLMAIIMSETLIERDDTVSENVIGVITRETSSSSGDLVAIERDDGLKIMKIRGFNALTLIVALAPTAVSILLLFFAQFGGFPPAEFLVSPP
ncbi:hypothetical protein TVAG_049120 [Trichomonas vaginalis G3]|uniref:Uncharacterized protein n=2 Tax=Trichomonas vaginalis (strain ATCC PRA-98 / G3) TaxID=412133 RepID=A2FJR1_TRIV3|nr:hypothetical protein TVAG_049120 [Trichomonas vaginalis G3]|eukprot:XP_001307773.1 hypothetical protein [Trichomonas vaginalis G3]